MTKTETKNLWKSLMSACAKKDHPHVAMLDTPYYDKAENAIVATDGHTLVIFDATLFKVNIDESGYVDFIEDEIVPVPYKKDVQFPNWTRIRDRETSQNNKAYEDVSVNEYESFVIGYWLVRKNIFINPKFLKTILPGRYTISIRQDTDNPFSSGTVRFVTTIDKKECQYIIAGMKPDDKYFEA